jgi:NarL family two-component system response regulator LiaR
MNEKTCVLIVDDHEVLRGGVRAFLEFQPEFKVVGEADGGEHAIKLVEQLVPGVILMDLVMSGVAGVEATRRVNGVSPRTLIVVLTSYHEDEPVVLALQTGAISYLPIDANLEDLAGAALKAVRGEPRLHPRAAVRVIREIHGAKMEEVNPFTTLTVCEFEAMAYPTARSPRNSSSAATQ